MIILIYAILYIIDLKKALVEATSQTDIQTDKSNVTLNEREIIKLINSNPTITQTQIADELGVNVRTIIRRMKLMQEKGIIKRENGKRNGTWIINE